MPVAIDSSPKTQGPVDAACARIGKISITYPLTAFSSRSRAPRSALESVVMSPSQRLRFFLFVRIWCVPAILVIVACVHLNQWHTIKRSSWGTGAGFGMFATVDYHGSRFVYCKADTDHGPIELTRRKTVSVSMVPRREPERPGFRKHPASET